ncbi:MAG TPA: hypothetical protein PLC76_06545 [Saprospiraceae bacterium]|jgi:hypothetical protein|nr:MAG: tonB dependent receptor [Candidatus Parvibacillus calidus]MBX2937456.1 hypothetical protein [Saprospiraceae bacterium]MBX7178934.1 hypothetical protein [Saprospiraceae bacterium]MCB0589842.1 hypothetical protein [Saprospiraceae bacterium]MCC7148204.1 hypothetical protein [Saprospiraceae bacterium]
MKSHNRSRYFRLNNGLVALLFFATTGTVMSQNDLPSGKVEVIKSYDAKLLPAEKLPLQGTIPEGSGDRKQYDYVINQDIKDKKPPVKTEAPDIRPMAVAAEKLKDSYKGYFKAGIGYPLAGLVEGAYSVTNTKNYFIDIFGHHYGVYASPRENQVFAETNVGVSGTNYLQSGLAMNGHVNFDLNNYRYYGGYNPGDTLFPSDPAKRRFTNIGAGLKIFNSKKNTLDLDYWAGADMYGYKDNFVSTERGFSLDIGATKWIVDRHNFTLQITDHQLTYGDTEKGHVNNVNVKPSFTFHGDKVKVKLGGNFVGSNGFAFFPDVEASANITGPAINVFVGAYGDLYQNSFKRLSTINPFIYTRFAETGENGPFNTKYYDFYGGVGGGFNSVNYRLKIGYKTNKDYALFVQQKEDLRQFDVIKDDVNIFYIGGELSASFFEKLNTSLHFLQQSASPRVQAKAYGIVPFEIGLNASYMMLEDKFKLKGDLNFAAGSPYRNRFDSVGNLNPMFDVSIQGDYFFTDNFGAFLMVNNLASVKYQRWYRYPTYGINILGGISLRF